MALQRDVKYSGRYDAATSAQPQGAFKNRTSPTSQDGSYLEKDWLNDWSGFMSSLLSKVGFTPNNSVDIVGASQYFDAMELGRPVENRFKDGQNWNVKGRTGHPLPGATPFTYPVGAEISYEINVFSSSPVVNFTYVNGVAKADSGQIFRAYPKDPSGSITKNSQYGGVKAHDGVQIDAIVDDSGPTGVSISETTSEVIVVVDMGRFPDGIRFIGLSDEKGTWPEISDDESRIYPASSRVDVTSSRSLDVSYVNNTVFTKRVIVSARLDGSIDQRSQIKVAGYVVANARAGGGSATVIEVDLIAFVKPNESYILESVNNSGTILKITEESYS